MKTFLNSLGFDYLSELLWSRNSSVANSKHSYSEVKLIFEKVRSEKKLDDAIKYCDDLLKREEERADKFETKASALIGFIGIVTTFIIGFTTLIFETLEFNFLLALTIGSLTILVVLSLMFTIYLALRVIHVGEYIFTYPSPNDILETNDLPLYRLKQERIASIFYSLSKNSIVANQKATFLKGAQIWFRNSVFLMLLLTIYFSVIYVSMSYDASMIIDSTITAIPSVTFVTSTPQFTETPFVNRLSTTSATPSKMPTAKITPTATIPLLPSPVNIATSPTLSP